MTQHIDGIEVTVKNFGHGEPFTNIVIFRGCATENDMTFRMYLDPTQASFNRAYNVALRIAGKQAMEDEHIDHLIAARNAITDRTDDYINSRAVDHIDAVLRDVQPSQRADVDALLGRKRIIMVQHAGGAVEVAPEFIPDAIDQGRRDWNSIKGDLDI